MKKALFLLFALAVTSFGIYSCQETVEQALPAVDESTVVSNRSFVDCDDCYNTCNDCCLTFTRISGVVTLVYVDDTNTLRTIKLTSATAQSQTVCARGGYLAIHALAGSAELLICNTGQLIPKTNKLATGNLTWDCNATLIDKP